MKMTIRPLSDQNLQEFLSYCRTYRFEHDESYLCESELENFVIGEDNPTFLLYDVKDQLKGVISVKIMPYDTYQRRGRIRILHVKGTKKSAFEGYTLLVNALLASLKQVDHLFAFLPEDKDDIVDHLMDLGFDVDRYPCLFVREDLETIGPSFPEHVYARPFEYCQDESVWLMLRNDVMQNVLGSEPPECMSVFNEFKAEEGEIQGGMQLLYHKDEPIGCARLVQEIDCGRPYIFIDTIGIIESYQGKGLGRQFLRYCLKFGADNGMKDAMLSVNAENKRATRLYMSEGFELAEVMTCLKYKL